MDKTMKNVYEKYLNKKGTVKMGRMEFEVIIKDYKNSYGKDRFLVSPTAGSGQVWVEKIKLNK